MKISHLGMPLVLGLSTMPFWLEAGPRNDNFLINPSKHYAYLKFDHVGEREPLSPDEPTKGLWLRFVNNCRLPIVVAIFDAGADNLGVGVFDEVIPATAKLPIVDYGGPIKPKPKAPPQEEPPKGYFAPDFISATIILPGKDLLFSVPLNHVGPAWYLQVRFYFALPGEGYGTGPYSVVSFDWQDIPEKFRASASSSASPMPARR
ncbi:MAG: hypothetical protein WBB89_16835 [Candidatus Acidiferrum sp.]